MGPTTWQRPTAAIHWGPVLGNLCSWSTCRRLLRPILLSPSLREKGAMGCRGEVVNWLQMTASEESGRMADLCCPKPHRCFVTTSSPCESAAPSHSPRSPFHRGCWSTDPCVWPDCKLCRTPAAGWPCLPSLSILSGASWTPHRVQEVSCHLLRMEPFKAKRALSSVWDVCAYMKEEIWTTGSSLPPGEGSCFPACPLGSLGLPSLAFLCPWASPRDPSRPVASPNSCTAFPVFHAPTLTLPWKDWGGGLWASDPWAQPPGPVVNTPGGGLCVHKSLRAGLQASFQSKLWELGVEQVRFWDKPVPPAGSL